MKKKEVYYKSKIKNNRKLQLILVIVHSLLYSILIFKIFYYSFNNTIRQI